MAFSNVPTDAGSIPLGVGYVPGVGFRVLQGSLIVNTDGSSNASAPIAIHHASGTVFTQASTAISTNVTNGPYTVGPYTELAVDINLTAKSGTSPTIQFFIDRIGADNIAYNIWSSASVTTTPTVLSASIGSGFTTNVSFGSTIQFRWTLGGTSPSYTFSCSIIGK